MRVTITGVNLPGRTFCRPDGSTMDQVHVGIQIRSDAAQLVRADAPEGSWQTDVDVVQKSAHFDFRGPAVQGKAGDRFIYLTWGNVDPNEGFEMFRRAKLMLHRIDPTLMKSAVAAGRLTAEVDLTDDHGCPRCARVDPPAVKWAVRKG